MSLKDLAQQMKATGRKGDTELVHMTKREVAGLQALAESAGGRLTKNPKTGLPEASFLEDLLPAILGIGANFIVPGSGMYVGALTGGLQADKKGQDPLMGALLGGFSGAGAAGIGAGLNTAGTSAATAAAQPAAEAAASQALADTARTSMGASASGLPFTGAEADVIRNQAMGNVYQQAATDFAAQPVLNQVGQGIGALGDAGGRTAFMEGVGGIGGLAKSGAMAAAPLYAPGLLGMGMRQASSEDLEEEMKDDEDLFGRYKYERNPTGGTRTPGSAFTGERTYFEPEYRRMFAAKGGEVKKFADGGEASAPSSMADPARGMTGMSRDAMMYLYGMPPSGDGMPQSAPFQTTQTPQAPNLDPYAGTLAPREGYDVVRSGFVYNPQLNAVVPKYEYQQRPAPAAAESTYKDNFWSSFHDPSSPFQRDSGGRAAGGEVHGSGIASLARGGMKAGGFVVPADVVSMVGEGNTDAGYERIKAMLPGATPIKGKDGGQADTVKTSIEGKQPARIAHGEMYVPPASVKRAGGAKKLYAMMDKVRKQATGNKKQIKPVNLKKALA
jgi:hypothetical protein